jgi:UDP-N-acetylmuramate--alanine ligase
VTLSGARRVHFIGIGGAGMSAIAKVLLERGYTITGSDLKRSRSVTILEAMGAYVGIGHNRQNIADAEPDAVVVSTAIPENNPELVAAGERHLEIMSRGQALAAILEDQKSIVVAGTHGKTTTTSMVVSILRHAGLDPTYLVGGGLNDVGTNARHGRDEIAVAESDESDGSFLLLSPLVGVVTNIEADHLDYWGSPERVKEGFARFMSQVRPEGMVIVPAADPELVSMAVDTGRAVVRFGEGGDVVAEGMELRQQGSCFVLAASGERAEVELRVPGAHNVANALAAAAACLRIGLSVPDIARGLTEFSGLRPRDPLHGTGSLPSSSRIATHGRKHSVMTSANRSSMPIASSSPMFTAPGSSPFRESRASLLPTPCARRSRGGRSPTCHTETICLRICRERCDPATPC